LRIEAELKRELARGQHRGGAQERRQVARELDLPVRNGRVAVPDAQIEYRDAQGRTGRVSIEIVSENYSDDAIAGKAAAGFSLHSAGGGGGTRSGGRTTARIAAALGRGAGSGSRSGGGRGHGRAGGSIDL